MSTAYHAKYYANEISRSASANEMQKISMSLFDASIDITPHQIEAALFVFNSPLSKGVLLADEVGLGKTIEAGLVICQYWAERKRKLLVICPSSLRKQWSLELKEKFNLDNIILETKNFNQEKKNGTINPFEQDKIIISSFQFASKHRIEIKTVQWDLAVIDEAHKLRNVYKSSNKIGKVLKEALEGKKKALLTATPLQNSLLELYGLAMIIDERIFGDIKAFRANYVNELNLDELKTRLHGFCKRTLRADVQEYVNFTKRIPLTIKFKNTDSEQEFYETISEFLKRDDTFAIKKSQRILTTLVLRKLLASSTSAIKQTLQTIKDRLLDIRKGLIKDFDFNDILDEDELEIEEENNEEIELEQDIEIGSIDPTSIKLENNPENIKINKLDDEIAEIERFIKMATLIETDTKSKYLLGALKKGFEMMNQLGGKRKALIFTESRRTQDYLKAYLEANGYKGKIVLFNGSNADIESKEIYKRWVEANKCTGRLSGSLIADKRAALIEYFRDEAEIMLATEAASEGVNIQFCSLVVNYDLPWNPQRIEQRIGRCHRYGQLYDVVVINFLNLRNHADIRVYKLLEEKFHLFEGVFGSSDEVLGTIESGVDFERKILEIYQRCRPKKDIDSAFKKLQKELEVKIKTKREFILKSIFDKFDVEVHRRLKIEVNSALDKIEKMFWILTKYILQGQAQFDDNSLSFNYYKPFRGDIQSGIYNMISKTKKNVEGSFLYRLSHPIGEYVLGNALELDTPKAKLIFDISTHPVKISIVEDLKGKKGFLMLSKLTVYSFEKEEYLLFNGFTNTGEQIDQEICEKIFQCDGRLSQNVNIDETIELKLIEDSKVNVEVTKNRVLDENNKYFKDEQDKLQKWADDIVKASEKELEDIKNYIKDLNRKLRLAENTEEQLQLQTKISELERQKRHKRQNIFNVEDDVEKRRKGMIEDLKKKMFRSIEDNIIFIIEWEIV
ncbi:MAG: DEAD/DEAH box helicase [Nitrospirae bacterium]|nr:DEAD/DEAH box helicase [Nitrospirota bacterium]